MSVKISQIAILSLLVVLGGCSNSSDSDDVQEAEAQNTAAVEGAQLTADAEAEEAARAEAEAARAESEVARLELEAEAARQETGEEAARQEAETARLEAERNEPFQSNSPIPVSTSSALSESAFIGIFQNEVNWVVSQKILATNDLDDQLPGETGAYLETLQLAVSRSDDQQGAVIETCDPDQAGRTEAYSPILGAVTGQNLSNFNIAPFVFSLNADAVLNQANCPRPEASFAADGPVATYRVDCANQNFYEVQLTQTNKTPGQGQITSPGFYDRGALNVENACVAEVSYENRVEGREEPIQALSQRIVVGTDSVRDVPVRVVISDGVAVGRARTVEVFFRVGEASGFPGILETSVEDRGIFRGVFTGNFYDGVTPEAQVNYDIRP